MALSQEDRKKVKFEAAKIDDIGVGITIEQAGSLEHAVKLIEAPEGVAHHMKKEALDCLEYFKGFAEGRPLHLCVEILNAKGKTLKHRNEYRKTLPGMEAAQITDLLTKLPAMVTKLKKFIDRDPNAPIRCRLYWAVVSGKIDGAPEVLAPNPNLRAGDAHTVGVDPNVDLRSTPSDPASAN